MGYGGSTVVWETAENEHTMRIKIIIIMIRYTATLVVADRVSRKVNYGLAFLLLRSKIRGDQRSKIRVGTAP